MDPIYAIVGSGQNVSGDINLGRRALVGIQVPTLGASGALVVQGNMNQTSAQFVRMLTSSGDLSFPVGVGSRFVTVPDNIVMPPFARLEIATAAGSLQTDNRTFTLLTRPR
jgi:hypothetical protein